MNPVEPCSLADLEQVARLHMRAFVHSPRSSPNGLVDYYRETFFENPWVDSKLPSLVSRDGDKVIGFLLRNQWRRDDCFACNPKVRIDGGFSEHMASPRIRIDYVQHAWAAMGHGAEAIEL